MNTASATKGMDSPRTRAHTFSIGTWVCTALADGSYTYQTQALLANAPASEVEDALHAHGLKPPEVPLDFTALLIDTGRSLVLVDTGLGAGAAPTAGGLLENLRARGVNPADVDTVVLTHGHPDHLGGTLDGSHLAFPNARHLMSGTDWRFWTSEETLGKLDAGGVYGVGELDHVMESFARKNLPPVASHVELLEGESDIVPGIRAIPAPGHSPGHLALQISSGDETLLLLADAVLHPIHLERPDWYSIFDLLPEEAADTRRALLDRAAAVGCLVMAYHFPFPGLGRVVRRERGWEWDADAQIHA